MFTLRGMLEAAVVDGSVNVVVEEEITPATAVGSRVDVVGNGLAGNNKSNLSVKKDELKNTSHTRIGDVGAFDDEHDEEDDGDDEQRRKESYSHLRRKNENGTKMFAFFFVSFPLRTPHCHLSTQTHLV